MHELEQRIESHCIDASPSTAIALSLFAIVLFAVLSCQFAFVLTTPSDPLQYVAPALRPAEGFSYVDRIVVWLWIRLVAALPMPTEMIGGVSTLIITSTTLFIGTWWLARRVKLFAGAIFGALYIASPMVVGTSTYTFPMQPLTLVLLTTLVLMDFSQGNRRHLIGGIGGGIASLCKIQGVTFLAYLAFETLTLKHHRLNRLGAAFIGFILGVLSIFMIITALDGGDQLIRIFKVFFMGGVAQFQFRGRGLGGMPPFYAYLVEPTCIAALAGMVLPWLNHNMLRLRPFAAVAAVQTIGLIGIYALTQRGGPLIYNYSIDALILGLIAFAGAATSIINKENHKNRHELLMGALLLAGTFLVVEASEYFSQEAVQYWPAYSFYTELIRFSNAIDTGLRYRPAFSTYLDILALMAVWLSILIFILTQRQKLTPNRIRSTVIVGFVLLALGVGLRAGEGVKDGTFRKQWSEPYHLIGRKIALLSPDSVWVSVKLNRNSIFDASTRVKRVYNAFYSGKNRERRNDAITEFGEIAPESFRFLLSDQPDLIHKYSGLNLEAIMEELGSGHAYAIVDRVSKSVVFYQLRALN